MTEKNLIRVYKGATSEKRIDINIKNYTKFIGMPKRSNTYPTACDCRHGRQCISSLDYKKKKIKVNVGAFMGSKVIDALLNDERGIK